MLLCDNLSTSNQKTWPYLRTDCDRLRGWNSNKCCSMRHVDVDSWTMVWILSQIIIVNIIHEHLQFVALPPTHSHIILCLLKLQYVCWLSTKTDSSMIAEQFTEWYVMCCWSRQLTCWTTCPIRLSRSLIIFQISFVDASESYQNVWHCITSIEP